MNLSNQVMKQYIIVNKQIYSHTQRKSRITQSIKTLRASSLQDELNRMQFENKKKELDLVDRMIEETNLKKEGLRNGIADTENEKEEILPAAQHNAVWCP